MAIEHDPSELFHFDVDQRHITWANHLLAWQVSTAIFEYSRVDRTFYPDVAAFDDLKRKYSWDPSPKDLFPGFFLVSEVTGNAIYFPCDTAAEVLQPIAETGNYVNRWLFTNAYFNYKAGTPR